MKCNTKLKAFMTGGLELKKEILLALGKTPIIKDKKFIIEPNEWLVPIKNTYPALEAEYLRLEPTKMPINKAKTEALASVRAHWLHLMDEVRNVIEQRNIYIPNLNKCANR